jgi:hypothetical protein
LPNPKEIEKGEGHMDAILKTHHEDLFLQSGYLLALRFKEGYACFRIEDVEWSNLEPWPLGAVAAAGSLTEYDQVQDANANHYLEPFDRQLIYHSFWGVTPAPARIFVQFPGRTDIGSMLSTPRTLTGDVGYIDGHKSPFWGPYSKATEIITVKEKYPQFQVLNPTGDAFVNVMLNFDQRHYTYQIIRDPNMIRDMILNKVAAKKYTMGPGWAPMAAPLWLTQDLGKLVIPAAPGKPATPVDYMKYSLSVIGA